MSNETNDDSLFGSAKPASSASSAPAAKTAGSAVSKVFREFKWGLLTLFLLMVVVVALVYEGGKKRAAKQTPPETPTELAAGDAGSEARTPAVADASLPGTGAATEPEPPPDWAVQQTPAARPPAAHEARPPSAPATRPVDAVEPAAPAAPDRIEKLYTVKSGDSLTKIARQFYGADQAAAGARAIAQANAKLVPDVNRIKSGTVLKVPQLAPTAAPHGVSARPGSTPAVGPSDRKGSESASAEAPKADGRKVYVVQKGDSLESIAEKMLKDRSRWREIANINGLKGTRVRAGQKLMIVADASAPQDRPAP